MLLEFAIFGGAAVSTYVGVGMLRRWTLRRKLFDIPNERSSHSRPTPRGGGLVIVLVNLIFYFLYTVFYSGSFSWSYFTGAVLIALISWLDDLYSVSIVWRLLIHAVAAILVISTFSPQIQQTDSVLLASDWGKLLYLTFCFFWIVWMTNAYNFMDGIDGIAALQAITAGIGWLVAGRISGLPAVEVYGGVLAFAGLGFIFHNWQPAKIFMGDVGSAFLGYTFAVLPFLAIESNKENFGKWHFVGVMLVWLFLFDTGFTFCRRLLKGEKFWQAHRSHLYQRIVMNGFSHKSVALLYGALSLINVVLISVSFFRTQLAFILYAAIIFESVFLIAFTMLFGSKKVLQK